jgi:hypothetical protein
MALALGAVAALLACGTAQASDDFHITAGGDQNWGPSSGATDDRAGTKREATGTMIGDNNAQGSVDYHLQAGPGIARASMDGHVTVPSGLGYPFNPSVQAVAVTDLTVSGPEPEVNTSLNLHVDGVIESTVCPGGPPCGTLSIFINAPTGTTAGATAEFNARGETRVNDLGLAFDPVPGGYRVHGDVTSRQFGLRTGTPNPIGIVLNIGGRFGGNPAGESFGGSADDPGQRWQVSFAPSGPVLNLPAGYDVTGSAVVHNRWDDPFAHDTVVTDCSPASLAQLTTIPGSLVMRCAGGTFPNLTHIGGDIVVDGEHSPHLAFPGPVLVDGSVRVVGTDGGGDLDLGAGTVAGSVDVSGTGGDLEIGIGSAAGAVDISGTGGDLEIGIGSAAGTVDISGTGGDLTVDTGTTGGDLDITDNPGAGVIDVGDGQIGGDLTITDNGTAVVNADDSLTVSGDATVETDGGGMLDLSGVDAGGDETVVADGASGVTADTAGGATDVSIGGGTAAMHVVLPDGAFDQPVAFTITRRGDDPAEGAIDPLAGYAFAFAVPALNADADLSFTVDLGALDAATRSALLAGIGTATIATKPDAPGSAYTALARCSGTQTPAADHCVAVTLLAGDGSLAPAGSEPAFARFDGIAGHFSTWAVALVRAVTGGGSTPPPTRPTAAQIRALLRKQITPHGKAARIAHVLKHRYQLSLRALVAGTAKVQWVRTRKHGKPVVIATGRHTFGAAGRSIIRMKLTAAGRRQLRHAKRLELQAKGTFTPAADPPVTATRRFTLKR